MSPLSARTPARGREHRAANPRGSATRTHPASSAPTLETRAARLAPAASATAPSRASRVDDLSRKLVEGHGVPPVARRCKLRPRTKTLFSGWCFGVEFRFRGRGHPAAPLGGGAAGQTRERLMLSSRPLPGGSGHTSQFSSETKVMSHKRFRVGVLGATGMVGQRFLSLLEQHPWYEVTLVAASVNSAGQRYDEAVRGRWALNTPVPGAAARLTVRDAADVKGIAEAVDFVFCAVDMPKDATARMEEAYTQGRDSGHLQQLGAPRNAGCADAVARGQLRTHPLSSSTSASGWA